MDALLGFPLAAAMLASCLWIAYLAAARLTASSAPHARLAAAALLAMWLQVTVFTALGRLHLFRIEVAAPLWLCSAALAHVRLGGGRGLTELGRDLDAARGALAELLRSPLRALLLVPGVGIVGSRLLRDLVSPPLAWDAFLYHLYNPARWIQHGGTVTERAPDGWGYLEYFPHAGDVTWAWAMLPVHGDALVAPAGVMVWSACLLGAYALSRELGAERVHAGLAAVAVGFIPAVANLMTSSYADDFVLAVFLLSGVSLARLARRPWEGGEGGEGGEGEGGEGEGSAEGVPSGDALLAGAGLGLLASAKLSGLPALGLGLLFVAWLVSRTGAVGDIGDVGAVRAVRAARLRAIALAAAAAAIVAAPGYLRAWIETGQPFYPLTVSVGGRTLFDGNEELRLLYAGRLHDLSGFDDSLRELLRVLTIPVYDAFCEHGGFGYGVFGLVLLASPGGFGALRDRRTRAVTLFLAGAAVLPFVALLTPGFLAHRTVWRMIIGRLVASLPALFAVLGARVPGRLARAAWAMILLLSYAASVPQGWSAPALEGMLRLAAPLSLGAGLGAVIFLVAWRFGRAGWGAAVGVLAFAASVAVPVARVRADLRYPIFASHGAVHPSYQIHTLEPTYASSWTIWRYLDDGVPHRIALAAGWDGMGHNWYRYPLMGSRLQNEVIYVPFTGDGSIVDYRLKEAVSVNADYEAWLSRLVARRVDFVVILYPWPVEQGWMADNPDRFELVVTSTEGYNLAYRFRRDLLPGAGP